MSIQSIMNASVQTAPTPATGGRSFFLFGPRGTGKTTWIKQRFPNALYLALLDHALYLELLTRPQPAETRNSLRQYRNRYWNFTKTARFVRWRPSTRSPRPPTSYQSVRSPSIRSACW